MSNPANDTTPTSPSPPPQPPIPLTPGPRALALQELYTKTLKSTLSAISYPSFASCFPHISSAAPDALKAMHKDLVGKLEKFANEEFELIMNERKVVERLNSWEAVIADGRRRKARSVETGSEEEIQPPIAPHTLPPPTLLAHTLLPLHTSQQSTLNAKLQTISSQNASLASEITSQRQEIQDLLDQVSTLVRDLEESGELLSAQVDGVEGADGTGGLSMRAREAEGVLSEVERTGREPE